MTAFGPRRRKFDAGRIAPIGPPSPKSLPQATWTPCRPGYQRQVRGTVPSVVQMYSVKVSHMGYGLSNFATSEWRKIGAEVRPPKAASPSASLALDRVTLSCRQKKNMKMRAWRCRSQGRGFGARSPSEEGLDFLEINQGLWDRAVVEISFGHIRQRFEATKPDMRLDQGGETTPSSPRPVFQGLESMTLGSILQYIGRSTSPSSVG